MQVYMKEVHWEKRDYSAILCLVIVYFIYYSSHIKFIWTSRSLLRKWYLV